MANVDITKEVYGKVEGQSTKLIYGKSLEYKVGASSSVAVSSESKLKCGASNGVETGLHGHFSFYDVKVDDHFGGAAFAIEHANRKSFKDAFAISAGAESKKLFWTLKLFAAGTILTQVGLAIAAGAHYDDKIKYAELITDKESKDFGKWANKKDEEDAMAVAIRLQAAMSAVAPMLALITAVILFIRKKSITDQLIHSSCAAFSITKNSKAFIGVRSEEGATGLVLRENLFSLALLRPDAFRAEGHEVVGFDRTDEYTSNKQVAGILGTKETLELTGAAIIETAYGDGMSATVTTGALTDKKLYGVSIHVDGNTPMPLPQFPKSPIIDIKSNGDVAIQGGKDLTTAGLIKLKDKLISLKVGVMGIAISDNQVGIETGVKDQLITVAAAGINIQHGTNKINLSAAGIDMAGGALKILNPTVTIPDFKKELDLEIQAAQRLANDSRIKAEALVEIRTEELKQRIRDMVDQITRNVEAKIDSAIGK